MTDSHDARSLSRVELIVLARMSDSKAPTQADIAKSLSQLGFPLTGPALTDRVIATLATLQGRDLVAVAASPSASRKSAASRPSGKRRASPRPATPRFALTDSGQLALRQLFGVAATPTWKDICSRLVPALALGLAPGSKATNAVLRSTEAMTSALLRRDRVLGEPVTVSQLCDQVIARALGMPPGPVTPAGIRAYALAMHCGVASKAEFEALAARFAPSKTGKSAKLDHELKALAAQFARDQLHAPVKTKAAMTRGLQRHWLSQRDEADDAHRSPQPWSALLRPAAAAHGEVQPPPLQAVGADGLLAAVRDAIPQIGADGRFGKENVFVAALWQRLAHDHRVPDLSLDRFKRWLVVANRDQLVDLARADLVDAMNPRLVEESEIEDLGATFHFVVDRQRMPAPGQVDHAR